MFLSPVSPDPIPWSIPPKNSNSARHGASLFWKGWSGAWPRSSRPDGQKGRSSTRYRTLSSFISINRSAIILSLTASTVSSLSLYLLLTKDMNLSCFFGRAFYRIWYNTLPGPPRYGGMHWAWSNCWPSPGRVYVHAEGKSGRIAAYTSVSFNVCKRPVLYRPFLTLSWNVPRRFLREVIF